MKYLESYYIRPTFNFNVGDWVKINPELMGDTDFINDNCYNFLDNNIGKIVGYDRNRVLVMFFDIPSELRVFFDNSQRSYKLSRIEYYAPTKKEVEDKLKIEKDLKKYNL